MLRPGLNRSERFGLITLKRESRRDEEMYPQEICWQSHERQTFKTVSGIPIEAPRWRKMDQEDSGQISLLRQLGSNGRWSHGVMERIPGDGWEEALSLYKAQAEALHSGKTPRPASDGIMVMDVCNFFLTSKQMMVDSGELSPRTFSEYRKTT